jgi:hypothetical protein
MKVTKRFAGVQCCCHVAAKVKTTPTELFRVTMSGLFWLEWLSVSKPRSYETPHAAHPIEHRSLSSTKKPAAPTPPPPD